MNLPPYLLLSGAPIGPLAEKHLRLLRAEPTAVIDTKLSSEKLIEQIEAHSAAFLFVVGYGAILKRPVLDAVAGQVLNLHPSLLPLHRGPAPVVQTILDGDSVTGVTIIEIDEQMDHGPILAQEAVTVPEQARPNDLYEVLTRRGVELFLDVIEGYLEGEDEYLPQAHEEATFTRFVKKEDGRLNLSDDPEVNERKVRAYTGWPTAFVEHEGKRLIIHSAQVSDGQFWPIEVQPENGKRMTFQAYCAGKRLAPATVLSKLS